MRRSWGKCALKDLSGTLTMNGCMPGLAAMPAVEVHYHARTVTKPNHKQEQETVGARRFAASGVLVVVVGLDEQGGVSGALAEAAVQRDGSGLRTEKIYEVGPICSCCNDHNVYVLRIVGTVGRANCRNGDRYVRRSGLLEPRSPLLGKNTGFTRSTATSRAGTYTLTALSVGLISSL